jgi:hypothetical protein
MNIKKTLYNVSISKDKFFNLQKPHKYLKRKWVNSDLLKSNLKFYFLNDDLDLTIINGCLFKNNFKGIGNNFDSPFVPLLGFNIRIYIMKSNIYLTNGDDLKGNFIRQIFI